LAGEKGWRLGVGLYRADKVRVARKDSSRTGKGKD